MKSIQLHLQSYSHIKASKRNIKIYLLSSTLKDINSDFALQEADSFCYF